MTELEEVLKERGSTHGDFTDLARCSQRLKTVVNDELSRRGSRGQPALALTQREALDMILHKIGRIIAGDPDLEDHWQDISGYAEITRQRIGKTNKGE